jgi:hypothetical protein
MTLRRALLIAASLAFSSPAFATAQPTPQASAPTAVSPAKIEEIGGTLADGTRWVARKPANWNGALLLDLDGAGFAAMRPPPGMSATSLPTAPPTPTNAYAAWLLAQGLRHGRGDARARRLRLPQGRGLPPGCARPLHRQVGPAQTDPGGRRLARRLRGAQGAGAAPRGVRWRHAERRRRGGRDRRPAQQAERALRPQDPGRGRIGPEARQHRRRRRGRCGQGHRRQGPRHAGRPRAPGPVGRRRTVPTLEQRRLGQARAGRLRDPARPDGRQLCLRHRHPCARRRREDRRRQCLVEHRRRLRRPTETVRSSAGGRSALPQGRSGT